ncbi:hypothetical protein WME75_28820 [Sorangium sp. So ce1014]|uniref:hypothetical protein n=1 Tax=Sorangium sp. So ce1014 TaxID=3133326 RepID=UPI003F623D13
MRRRTPYLRAPGAPALGFRLAALAPAALAVLAAAAPPALAAGAPLAAPLVESKWLKFDGIPKEWPVALTSLGIKVKGKPSKADLAAHAAIAYDDARIYVAADVTDDALRGGADHVKLVLGFPGGKVREVALYPGQPGKTGGSVKLPGGKAVAGAKVIEAPRSGGYTLEASIPWSAFPEAATTRVGLRAGLFVHDADGAGGVEAIVGSAASEAYGSLSPLATEPELALTDGLLRSKGIRGAPKYDLVVDVAGDAMRERVIVHERFLVVLGPGFRKGAQYYFEDLGVDASDGMLPSLTARDLTGDGQAELILRKRTGSGAKYREVMHVVQFGAGDTPKPIFQHEVAISTEKGSVVNEVEFVPDGARMAIRVEPGKATRYDASNYAEGVETTYDPLLLPWGSIKSQLYKLTGGVFTKASEQRQAPAAAARPAAKADEARGAAKPPALSPAEMLDKVYALYRRDRGASSSKPRFDLAADVAAGREPERVLLHDRDLVVFGKGFRGGAGYAFMTLAQFASPGDIRSVSARDLTGDGKADIIVHGTVRAAAPKDAGGGTVDRDVVLIFRIEGEGIQRIFAAEVARSMDDKKIAGELRFVRVDDKVGIELAPGRAIEWTEQTYPFNQDKGPVGGFEPLLLPWGGAQPVRYVWNGSTFAK